MPDEFVNPYQFVPLKPPTADDYKSVEHAATHDRYVTDSRSGSITCTLMTESPLVIGANRTEPSGGSPAIVSPYLGLDGHPAIPASSLRGLISSIYETASNSALRVLANTLLSVRVPAEPGKPLPCLGMLVPGGIQKLDLENRRKVQGYAKRANDELMIASKSFLDREKPDSTSAEHPETWYVPKNGNPIAAEPTLQPTQNGDIPGVLRVLGIEGREKQLPIGRLRELFVPFGNDRKIYSFAPGTLEDFFELADQMTREQVDDRHEKPFHLKGAKRNADPTARLSGRGMENRIPLRPQIGDLVFFRTGYDKNSNSFVVTELAVSQIWRKRIGKTYDFFRTISKDLLPFNQERSQLTIAERVFGFVEVNSDGSDLGRQAKGSASRLKFGDAKLLTDGPVWYQFENGQGVFTLKELSNPKPPCPSMYFSASNGNAFIDKTTLNPCQHVPRGRKFYVHPLPGPTQPGWKTMDTVPNSEANNRKAKVTPLKSGLEFRFTIRFDNLTDRELGFLLYALKPSDKFRHKLGMGKPLGLGTVKIDVAKLILVDRKKRYEKDDPFHAPSNTEYEGSSDFVVGLRNAVGQCPVLEQIGDPSSTTSPVHYPQVAGIPTSGAAFEKEIYKWFVSNDKNHKNPSRIPTGKGELPKLPRFN